MEINCITSLPEAEVIWKKLSPNISIYDTWEFRMATYSFDTGPLFFYTAFEGLEPIAVLPLQKTTHKGYLEFFGGSMHEDNRVFYKPGFEHVIPELYKQVQQKARLEYIIGDDPFTTTGLQFLDYKYFLPLAGFTGVDDYIETAFKGETKKKFVKRLRKLEEQGAITITYNNWEDLELLFQINLDVFGADSTFHFPHRQDIYRVLAKSSFDPLLMTFSVNGEKQAVAFSLAYQGKFFSLKTSVKREADQNLSSFARVKKINEAIKRNLLMYEAQAADCGWKESWHFSKVPLYAFVV